MRLIGLLACGLVFTANAVARDDDVVKKELARLCGDWWEVVDAKVTKSLEHGKIEVVWFDAKLASFSRDLGGVGSASSGPYKIDPTKTPKAIDITVVLGGTRKTELYVYELDGDTLRLHRSYKGDRPTDFVYREGETALFTFKRVPMK